MIDKYRIALIGLGSFGQKYVETIDSHFPNIELVFSSRQTNHRPDFLPPNCHFTTNWQDVWNFSPDGIIVATEPNNHLEVALAVYKAGIPTLIEKPICLESQQLHGLPDNAKILVNYIHLFSPSFNKLQTLVDNEDCASILTFGCNNGPHREFSSLFDYGSHDIAMILDTVKQYPISIHCKQMKMEKNDLFSIKLQFQTFGSYSLVGNGSSIKRREFYLTNKIGVKYTYNDVLANNKICVSKEIFKANRLKINRKYPNYDSTQPLIKSIESLLNLINGEITGNIILTKKVTKILDECYKQTHNK